MRPTRRAQTIHDLLKHLVHVHCDYDVVVEAVLGLRASNSPSTRCCICCAFDSVSTMQLNRLSLDPAALGVFYRCLADAIFRHWKIHWFSYRLFSEAYDEVGRLVRAGTSLRPGIWLLISNYWYLIADCVITKTHINMTSTMGSFPWWQVDCWQ